MPKYTTGELAKLCGVSVRTVQYYDSRNILIPTALSEGGRRLYSEEDLKKMKSICFLRDMGFPLNDIGELFSEANPDKVISLLIEQQGKVLRDELAKCQTKLELLEQMKRELKSIGHFSVESISDIAYAMENKKNLRKLHMLLLFTGIPLDLLQWTSILVWIFSGIWWPFVGYVVLAIPYAVWITKYYFTRAAYICPECHMIFKPIYKEALWAKHTPTLRKLTCTCCGYHGFCVETYGVEKKDKKGENA